MASVLAIAQSGLALQAQRLNVSANNVANAITGGFVPSSVAAQALGGGGVVGQVVQPNDPAFESRLDRTITSLSGTDLERETVDQMSTVVSFGANVASVQSADEALGTLMSAVGAG
jgi:flagellar basal body rod protein FlgG